MSAMIVDFIAAAAVDRFDEPRLLTPVLPCSPGLTFNSTQPDRLRGIPT